MSAKDREMLYQHARAIGEASRLCCDNNDDTLVPMSNEITTIATSLDMQAKFHGRINLWLDTLNAIAPEGYSYECDTPGQKFCRIVMTARGGQRSVHAFYNLRTGDVHKAAGWKAPAKIVRFNLLDDASFNWMMENIDWSGGYLYLK